MQESKSFKLFGYKRNKTKKKRKKKSNGLNMPVIGGLFLNFTCRTIMCGERLKKSNLIIYYKSYLTLVQATT